MIVKPSDVLRAVGTDLKARRPVLTVGDLMDRAVMGIIEDGEDWRDLSPKAEEADGKNQRRYWA